MTLLLDLVMLPAWTNLSFSLFLSHTHSDARLNI